MSTKLDARQVISRDLLDQAAQAAGAELDNLLRSFNSNDTPPLKMSVTGNDRTVNIGNITVTNPETSKRRTIPPISNVIPNFATGAITADATGAGSLVFSPALFSPIPIGMAAGQHRRFGINLDAAGYLTITAGTADAVLANATVPPVVSNTFAIGYFVLHTDGSNNVGDIATFDLYQYVGGGGGGGSGDANTILETLKNQFLDSTYKLMTPNIFSSDEDNKIDGASTGSYSLVSNSFRMESAQTMVSTQMLDPDEFLALGRGLGSVHLTAIWETGSIDTAATYEVSRNGGNEWQTITMERVGEATETYTGKHEFATEAANQTITENSAAEDITTTLSTAGSASEHIAQSFVISNTTVLRTITFSNAAPVGTPVGNIFLQIVADSAGVPSTSATDILLESSAIPASSFIAGANTFTIGEVVLVPGTYHLVVRSNDTYKAAAGANNIVFNGNTTADGRSLFNGTVWSGSGTNSIELLTKGIELDLRVKITAGTNGVALDGYGIFYDDDPVTVVNNVLQLEVRQFKAVADNFSTFTLTNFLPNPDLLKVYYIQGGQVFHYGAFALQGHDVVFPANTFNNNAVEADITLVFDQIRGGAYDNSDTNAALMAANFLGSTDAMIDRSANGRGIFLRRPDGTLREIAIDNSDNIVVYSV